MRVYRLSSLSSTTKIRKWSFICFATLVVIVGSLCLIKARGPYCGSKARSFGNKFHNFCQQPFEIYGFAIIIITAGRWGFFDIDGMAWAERAIKGIFLVLLCALSLFAVSAIYSRQTQIQQNQQRHFTSALIASINGDQHFITPLLQAPG